MGCCKAICKILLGLWTMISLLTALAIMGYMAFLLTEQSKAEKDPEDILELIKAIQGSGLYKNINMLTLSKFSWYAGLGLATLMFISAIIHLISICQKSRCLLGLSTLLFIIVLAGDVSGLILRFQAKDSIDAGLESSLNKTIIEQYGHPDADAITDAWNILGNKSSCCGVVSSQDFQLATHWSGEIKVSVPPCGASLDRGCAKTIRDRYINGDDIWLLTIFVIKIVLVVLTMMHTMCVCKLGLGAGNSDDRETEDYSLVSKR